MNKDQLKLEVMSDKNVIKVLETETKIHGFIQPKYRKAADIAAKSTSVSIIATPLIATVLWSSFKVAWKESACRTVRKLEETQTLDAETSHALRQHERNQCPGLFQRTASGHGPEHFNQQTV